MPEKAPVNWLTPLKIYVYAPVPPLAETVTVAVPPMHGMGVVTEAPAVIVVGWLTSSVPEPVQFEASFTLQAYPLCAEMLEKTPDSWLTPLKV